MPTQWETNSQPIPGYRLIERIGRGGYGEVWKVEAPGGLFKAIKFVFGDVSSNDASDRQALRELKALRTIRDVRHPFVLNIDRYDVIDSQLVIVTELAEQDLFGRLHECRDQGLVGIPRDELLMYLREAADALDTMNSRHGLQHLDVKPQNLFLIGGHIKVADFGLVKVLEGRSAAFTGGITPIYACPESFDGWVSRNSDQYSLAIVFVEMLTGRLPFPGPSPRQFMLQHLTHEPDLFILPEEDRDVVNRAMSKHPDARYQSCREFVDALPHSVKPTHVHFGGETVDSSATPTEAISGTQTQVSMTEFRYGWGVREPSRSVEKLVGNAGLVIGIGQSGIDCLRRLIEKFPTRSLETTSSVHLELLAIDSDARSLESLTTSTEGLQLHTVHCPLQKGNSYLRHWDHRQHLRGWLDPNLLFQISSHATANGHRGLGRLTWFDNRESIERQIRDRIESLSKQNRDSKKEIPVFVVADMGGGTGSGMFLDLCYQLREIIGEQVSPRFCVTGLLAARCSEPTSLVGVNQWALAEDIDRYYRSDSVFEVMTDSEGNITRYAGSPTQRLLICGSARRDKVLPGDVTEKIAEYVLASTVHDLSGWEKPAATAAMGSLGWFQVEYPEQLLLESVASEFSLLLCRQWCTPVPSRESILLHERAELALRQAGFETDEVMTKLQTLVDGMLATPLHVELAEMLESLEHCFQIQDQKKTAESFEHTLKQIGEAIGSDWDWESQMPRDTPLMGVAQTAIEKVYQELAESLTSAMRGALDNPGARYSRANTIAEGFREFFVRIIDRNYQQIRAERQALARRTRSILDQVQRLKSTETVVSRHVGALHGSLEEYGRHKISLRIREMAIQVYLRLRNKITQLQQSLDQFQGLLDQWLADLQQIVPTEPADSVTQSIFPGKKLRFQEARQTLVTRLTSASSIPELDRFVDSRTLSALGGLWGMMTPLLTAASDRWHSPIEAAVQQWVTAHMPAVDSSHCLVELHGGDLSRITQTLEKFFDWAKAASGFSSQNPIVHHRLLLVPTGIAGDSVAQAAGPLLNPSTDTVLRLTNRCVIGWVDRGRTIWEVLPDWMGEHRGAFEEKCASRSSPRIFHSKKLRGETSAS